MSLKSALHGVSSLFLVSRLGPDADILGAARRGRTYALTGPRPVTPRHQVEAIAAALGREVPFIGIGRQEAHARMAEVFGTAENAGFFR